MTRSCHICTGPLPVPRESNAERQMYCSDPCRQEAKRRRAYSQRTGEPDSSDWAHRLKIALYREYVRVGFKPADSDMSWWPDLVDAGYAAGVRV